MLSRLPDHRAPVHHPVTSYVLVLALALPPLASVMAGFMVCLYIRVATIYLDSCIVLIAVTYITQALINVMTHPTLHRRFYVFVGSAREGCAKLMKS